MSLQIISLKMKTEHCSGDFFLCLLVLSTGYCWEGKTDLALLFFPIQQIKILSLLARNKKMSKAFYTPKAAFPSCTY